jgi:hypothetical protein
MAGPPPPLMSLPASTPAPPPPAPAVPWLGLWLPPPMALACNRSDCSPAEAEDSCRLRLPLVACGHDTAAK